MKSLIHQLRASTRWAIAHDDDAVPGVYAVPGPRAQGDEAASEPVLSATLLDDVGETSPGDAGDVDLASLPAGRIEDTDGDPPPDGDPN